VDPDTGAPGFRVHLWLAVGYALLMLPQWFRLGLWMSMATVAIPLYQLAGTLGYWRRPGFAVRLIVTLLALVLFLITTGHAFTVATVASFFVLAVGLKWLEMARRRDVFVMFFILLYLAGINFLFLTGPGWMLVGLGGVLALFNALVWLHAGPAAAPTLAGTWRRMFGMTVLALPVVILLFIFFPRMGPLWSVPVVSQARTGMTDRISPGDLASLVRSDKRVFRVRFPGELPSLEHRYWRGLLLDRFDGKTWRTDGAPRSHRPGKVLSDAGVGPLSGNQYEVLMEPSYQHWAFALKNSYPVSDNIYPTGDGTFRFRRPVDSLVRYRMTRKDGHAGGSLTRTQWRKDTELPAAGNPKTRQWARDLARKTGSIGNFVQSVLRYFHDQPFYYTLKPPRYGANGIDAFLFSGRRGFCAHYASAMAFILRAAGIPARIVVGYFGGQKGLDGHYLIVRQYDAHAWVEFWYPGRGWRRIDPTAAIPPSRVEKDLRGPDDGQGQNSGLGWSAAGPFRDSPFMNWVRLRLDAVNFAWQRWVVNYHGQSQSNLLANLRRQLGVARPGWIASGLILGLMVLVSGWLYWRGESRDRDGYRKLYRRWLGVLRRGGVRLIGGETPLEAARQAGRRDPEYGRVAQSFARLVSAHYYAQAPVPLSRLRTLLREQRRLNRRLRGKTGA